MPRYDKPVSITKQEKAELQTHYQNLIYSFDKIDLTLLELQRDYQVQVLSLIIDLMQNSKDPVKLDKAFLVMKALMTSDEPVSRWLYEVDYIEQPEDRRKITPIALAIERYNAMKNKPHTEQTLNEKVVMLERILSVKIDVKVCPVSLFQEYERQAVEKVNMENKLLQ
jgi:ferredoxin-like protein FixX